MTPPLVAVTMGDPSGVGPEIIAKTFADPNFREENRALVVGDAKIWDELSACSSWTCTQT
jgi:4-hydroxythreonine-4-phosphate dehydrogenase